MRTAPLLARIRTIKPEAFVSESLATVSLTAERTFLGLLTQADDQGRLWAGHRQTLPTKCVPERLGESA